MNEFVLTVSFTVAPEHVEQFRALILENARQSVAIERGCLQFDVARQLDNPARFVLYEVYEDAAAFEAHVKMPHVAAFFSAAKPMIIEQTPARHERIAANRKLT